MRYYTERYAYGRCKIYIFFVDFFIRLLLSSQGHSKSVTHKLSYEIYGTMLKLSHEST